MDPKISHIIHLIIIGRLHQADRKEGDLIREGDRSLPPPRVIGVIRMIDQLRHADQSPFSGAIKVGVQPRRSPSPPTPACSSGCCPSAAVVAPLPYAQTCLRPLLFDWCFFGNKIEGF